MHLVENAPSTYTREMEREFATELVDLTAEWLRELPRDDPRVELRDAIRQFHLLARQMAGRLALEAVD